MTNGAALGAALSFCAELEIVLESLTHGSSNACTTGPMAAGDCDREEIVQGLLKSHQPRAPSETARGFLSA